MVELSSNSLLPLTDLSLRARAPGQHALPESFFCFLTVRIKALSTNETICGTARGLWCISVSMLAYACVRVHSPSDVWNRQEWERRSLNTSIPCQSPRPGMASHASAEMCRQRLSRESALRRQRCVGRDASALPGERSPHTGVRAGEMGVPRDTWGANTVARCDRIREGCVAYGNVTVWGGGGCL